MWLTGCSLKDITPDFPVILHGCGHRNDYSDGVEDPLAVGVIAIRDGEKTVLLITIDSLGVTMKDCQRIYKVVEEATGVKFPDVFIFSSHTHFAPNFCDYYVTMFGGRFPMGVVPGDDRYFEFFAVRLREALAEALDSLEPCSLETIDIPLPALNFNRRTIDKATGKCVNNYIYPPNPEDFIFPPVDPDLSAWRFVKQDGTPKAILARYSCHPVTGGQSYETISPDFPGFFRKSVAELCGCPGFFMQGNAGDVVPMRRHGNCRADLGDIMARSIRMSELKFRKVADDTLKTDLDWVSAKLNRFQEGYREVAEERWQQALAHARTLDHYDDDLWAESYRHGAARLYPEDIVQVPVQALRLGDRIIIGTPFEVVSAIGLQLREACPNAVMTTLTGGNEMYLPLASDFPNGGYETDWGANFAPETGDNLSKTAIDLARRIAK